MMDLQELRKWAAEMERSAEVLMTNSGGDKDMMSSAAGSSRVAWLLDQAAKEIATVTAQRDELLRAAVRVLNTSPKTCGSDTRQLDHFDACTDLGIVVERFAAVEQASDSGPVGINGQRDPDFPCDMFRNGKPSENNTCEGDGHYLCNECGHYRCDPPEESK